VLRVFAFLPWSDWAAVAWFFAAWIGYASFAARRGKTRPSLMAAGQRVRVRWMVEATRREPRVLDAIVLQNLTTSPSFFASTTILIVGGLLALLSSNEQSTAVLRELPFAARTSILVFDLKVMLLAGVFVFAFFRFTWSLRQYNFAALVVAAAPLPPVFDQGTEEARQAFARQAGGLASLAAESFNDGLRSYYMAFAAVAWFFSPLAFAIATAFVIVVLYLREFRSQALDLLH
jgi:uncharacterized membrane protein